MIGLDGRLIKRSDTHLAVNLLHQKPRRCEHIMHVEKHIHARVNHRGRNLNFLSVGLPAHVLRLTLLAPGIVEAILDGRTLRR